MTIRMTSVEFFLRRLLKVSVNNLFFEGISIKINLDFQVNEKEGITKDRNFKTIETLLSLFVFFFHYEDK